MVQLCAFFGAAKVHIFLVFERCIVFALAGISFVTQRFPVSFFFFFKFEDCIFFRTRARLWFPSLQIQSYQKLVYLFVFVRGIMIMAGAGRDSGWKGSGNWFVY